MPEEKEKIIQIISCPDCQGKGLGRYGFCAHCSGMGKGVFFQGLFLYFSLRLSRSAIVLKKARESAERILDLSCWFIAIAGCLSLIVWFWQTLSRELLRPEELFFWTQRHWLLAIFWCSLPIVMFLVYRRIQKKDYEKKIKHLPYEQEDKPLPENWKDLKKIKKRNIADDFNFEGNFILEKSFLLAEKSGHGRIEPLHIFISLISFDSETRALLGRLNIDQDVLASKLYGRLNLLSRQKGLSDFSPNAKEVILRAGLTAREQGQNYVKPLDLANPCRMLEQSISDVLYDLDVDENKLNNAIEWFRINDKQLENYLMYKKMARFKPSSNMDRAYTAVAVPLLSNFSYDLTLKAKYGRLGICVGREEEMTAIFDHFNSGKRGLILVGPDGVGKDTLVGGFAQLMVSEMVPKIFRDKRLLELDIARMLGGANPAQAQERMLAVVNEIARAGNIVLYIKDAENLMGITSGTEESLDLSEILANALDRKSFYCILSVTDRNYVQYLEGKPLGRILAKVEVMEPEINKAIWMTAVKVSGLEARYPVYFAYEALSSAVELSKRYLRDSFLPAKAVDILEEASARIKSMKNERVIIGKEEIAEVVSQRTKIPLNKVSQEEGKELLDLEEKIHERMINQESAVKMVSASLRRARAELRSGKRPVASFLFLGPTGVGKTELAKTLSVVYFGQENKMIRLDMSEYQTPDSVEKMIGNPEGVKGYLTEHVRQNPFSLILLDEIEKANPDILNLFLQVFDDGRLTDGQGQTIDFTDTIIIATSNIASLFIQEQTRNGADPAGMREEIINKYLSQAMRPELINRFDGIIIFHPLKMEHVVQVAKLMFKELEVLLEKKGIALKLDTAGLKILAEQGYQPEFGARPLRRLIQEKIEDAIANKILAGELDRRDIVLVNANAEVEIIKAEKL